MKNLITGFWYGDTMSDCDGIDCFFSDCDCVYRGNFYKNGRAVGDFTARTLQAIHVAWLSSHGFIKGG